MNLKFSAAKLVLCKKCHMSLLKFWDSLNIPGTAEGHSSYKHDGYYAKI